MHTADLALFIVRITDTARRRRFHQHSRQDFPNLTLSNAWLHESSPRIAENWL